jgi:hypothetical protein
MSFDLKRSYGTEQKERPLLSTAVLAEEGVALIWITDTDGVMKVKESAGAAGERFAGFAKTTDSDRTTEVIAETIVVPIAPGPYTATLSRGSLPGAAGSSEISAVASTTGTLTQVAGAPAGGQFSVNGTTGVVTFNAAQAGENVAVVYRHTLTVAEIEARYQGRHVNNQDANTAFRSVTVVSGPGDWYTDQYNVALVYALGDTVHLAANGRLSNAGVGTSIGFVTKLPATNGDGMLGIRFTVGP